MRKMCQRKQNVIPDRKRNAAQLVVTRCKTKNCVIYCSARFSFAAAIRKTDIYVVKSYRRRI